MPSSKDQFPDPWDPNASGSAHQSSDDQEDVTDSAVSDSDDSNEDFGLNELREMLGGEVESPQQPNMVIEDLEGLFPPENSPDSSFDDLFSSLGLSSAVSPNLDESQAPELSDLLSDLDSSVKTPGLEPLLVDPGMPDSASSSSDSILLEEVNLEPTISPSVNIASDIPVAQSNVDLGSDLSESELRLESESLAASPSLDHETPDIPLPETSSVSADFEAQSLADGPIDTDAVLSSGAIANTEIGSPVNFMDSSTENSETVPMEESPDRLAEPTIVSDSIDIPVVPSAAVSESREDVGRDSNDTSMVGMESASAPSPSLGSSGVPSGSVNTSKGGVSTYKQLLGGRKQVAAFSLILAGMGGIAGYGWSKAGIDNPFKTDFSQPRIGILADRQDDQSDDEAPTASSLLGIGGTDDGPLEPADSTSDSSQRTLGDDSALGDLGDLNADGFSPLSPGGVPAALSNQDSGEAQSEKSNESSNESSTSLTPPPIDISDVPPEHWAHPYVVAMHEQGIVPDFPDGKFQPDKPVTRAELAASIKRAFKDQAGNDPIPFSDISDAYWAKDAITHAVNKGFMSGYSDDIFEPEQRIPRYQVLVSLVSGLGLKKVEDSTEAKAILKPFPDVDTMPTWALGQVAASQKANLIVGDPKKSGNLEPNRSATRAEANAMIYQALVNAGMIEDTVQ